METFAEQFGPWAVVTGADAGVGLAWTRQLVDRGVNVVMVDIATSVEGTAASFGSNARGLVADVSDPNWLDDLSAITSDIEIGLAVANAGVSYVGRYLDIDAATRRRIIDVNCTATAELASWALPPMVERGRGGFITTSSGSALCGTAGVGLYSATKAFGVNLIEAIGWELRETGVKTLAVIAPTMSTPAFNSSGADPDLMLAPAVDPELVVSGALDALPGGGRWLADDGLAFAAGVERSERVDMMSAATTSMYPGKFSGR
jgi:short-subunit dehydrogenase